LNQHGGVIAAILTFLSSSAGGALLGLLQAKQKEERLRKEREAERLHEERLAREAHGAQVLSQRQATASMEPVRYRSSFSAKRRCHFLGIWRWGDPHTEYATRTRDKLSQLPHDQAVVRIVSLFALTYCLCALWVSGWIWFDFEIVSPNAKQAKFNLMGLFGVAFGGNKPVPQSGLSVLLFMLSPLMLVISNWIVRRDVPKSF